MKTICSYCRVLIRGDVADPVVSHGCCDDCAAAVIAGTIVQKILANDPTDNMRRRLAEWARDYPPGSLRYDRPGWQYEAPTEQEIPLE